MSRRFFPRTRALLSHTWQAIRADAGLGIIGNPSPDSDYWYEGTGYRSAAGPNVSPGTATRLGAVFACVRVCAETLSSLPVSIYRERKSGGRDVANDHPAYELFLQPNIWQTGMEFFEMMQAHLELRGNAYAIKVPGSGRAIDQLIPVHPDRVRVFLLPNKRLRYEVVSYSTGQVEKYGMEEIFHIRGWSFDGVMGISTVSALAEVIGVGLAQQEHRGRYFRNSAIPGMSVESPKMTPEATEEMRNSLREGFSGENAFRAFIAPPGVKISPLGLTSRDSQLIEASNASRLEICGGWRVPPHKIGDLSKGTFSNIEQQNIEFATDCMRPRVVRFERRLDLDIVGAIGFRGGDYYAVFNMDALFRGDLKSRYEAYAAAMPWMLRNEMRAAEGKNPIDGLDEPLVAVNMETVSQADARSKANIAAKQQPDEEDDTQDEKDAEDTLDRSGGSPETPGDEDENEKDQARDSQLRAIVMASASRIVRREVKALRKPETLSIAALQPIYNGLAPVIAESFAIPLSKARQYCLAHEDKLMRTTAEFIPFLVDQIEQEGPRQLADLVLRGRA